MKLFIVYVHNGYRYEYEGTIEAASIKDARAKWKRRGDWKTLNFRVSEVR